MTFWKLLQRRVRNDGARPLITCYDADGRTELSAITYANWVAKTANLLTDTIGAEAGDQVQLSLLDSDPGHWMTLVWVGACLSSGVIIGTEDSDSPVAIVTGPNPEALPSGDHRWACSLHPLGLGFSSPLPAGVQDFAAEVRSEADEFYGQPAAATDVAWYSVTQAELLAQLGSGSAERVAYDLHAPSGPGSDVVTALLLAPLVGGGSSVSILSGDPEMIAASELARLSELGRR